MILKAILNLIFLICVTSIASAETLVVLTKENAIREFPKFFSPVKIFVKYGDILEAINTEGDWYKVKFKTTIGYIHKSAIERRKISISTTSDTERYTTSETEVTLAGKGFNIQVENAYRDRYPQMRFNLVDKIESYNIPDSNLIIFIRNGGLIEPK